MDRKKETLLLSLVLIKSSISGICFYLLLPLLASWLPKFGSNTHRTPNQKWWRFAYLVLSSNAADIFFWSSLYLGCPPRNLIWFVHPKVIISVFDREFILAASLNHHPHPLATFNFYTFIILQELFRVCKHTAQVHKTARRQWLRDEPTQDVMSICSSFYGIYLRVLEKI